MDFFFFLLLLKTLILCIGACISVDCIFVCAGDLSITSMVDVNGQRISEIPFVVINVRNQGLLTVHNDQRPCILSGQRVQVFPGGRLSTRNAQMHVEELVVDVMGQLEADAQGYCNGGTVH